MTDRVLALEWDTEHWHRPTARVWPDPDGAAAAFADALRDACSQFDFVQTLVPVERILHIQVAEELGYRLVDVRCVVVTDRDQYLGRPAPTVVPRRCLPEHLVHAAELAAHCHTVSRFALDRRLDAGRVRDLYRRWVLRDAAAPGWCVGIAGDDEAPLGYVTFGLTDAGTGTIGLIGVRDSARGSGIGRQLLDHATEQCFAAGASRMEVVTQAENSAALGMYRSAGYTVGELGLWMHWHRDHPR